MKLDYPIYVFIDTNIYKASHYNFSEGDFSRLKKHYEQQDIIFITNELVVHEVKKNMEEDIKSAIEKYNEGKNQCLRVLKTLRNDTKYSKLFEAMPVSEIIRNYYDLLDNYLLNVGVIVLDNSYVSIEKIVHDYVNCNAPFESKKDKKHEFPDAIILESLCQYQSIYKKPIHIISKDKGIKKGLEGKMGFYYYEDIKKLLDRISSDNIVYSMLERYITDHIDIANSIVQDFLTMKVDQSDIDLQMVYSTKDDLCEPDFYDSIYDILECNYGNTTCEFYGIDEIRIDVNTKTENEFNGLVTVTYNYSADLDISFERLNYDESVYDSEDKKYFLKSMIVFLKITLTTVILP